MLIFRLYSNVYYNNDIILKINFKALKTILKARFWSFFQKSLLLFLKSKNVIIKLDLVRKRGKNMEEKLYKIKKGSEFNFYSTEPSATINKIVGKTTQETREGYNKLKYPYASLFTDTIFTDVGDGTIKLNGTLENNTSKYFVKNYFLKAGTYTFVTGLGKDINLPNTSYLLIKKSTESSFLVKGTRKDTEFTLDVDSNIDISVIYVAGAYNNVLLKPMLILGTEEKPYEQYGTMPSIDYPSPINSITNVDYKIIGKNMAPANVETKTISGVSVKNNNDGTYTLNGTTTGERSFGFYAKSEEQKVNLKEGKTYKLVVKEFSGSKTAGSVTSAVRKDTGELVYNYITQGSPVVTATYNSTVEFINLYVSGAGVVFDNYRLGIMLIEQGENEEFEAYKEKTTTITLPEGAELCSLPNGVEDCVDSTGVIHKKIGKIALGTQNWSIYQSETNADRYYCFTSDVDSLIKEYPTQNTYNFCNIAQSVEMLLTSTAVDKDSFCIGYQGTARLRFMLKKDVIDAQEGDTLSAKLNNLFISKNAYILAENIEETTQNLAEIEITKMQIFPVIIGENNLTGPSETTLFYYDERTEEEQIQSITITNGGKLLPFGLTVDFNKTNLPLIAEAIEASQTITGADGELVLDTTYGSRPFEIDAYTDDFLTPEKKEEKREEIREFLNSIKKVNTKLIIEPLNRTFEVKYAGLAEDTNLPKCVEFLIPLKSASSYAISNTTYTLNGEGELDSNTKEPTGFICTISGEAAYPELSINGYLMSYNNVILNGEQLIIDTRKCTVTKINKVGTKTNAMAYYNHQFPKIQNGTNIVSIISGIENSNLKIEWNDLFL